MIASGFPARDALIVEVGEKSGRLEEVFRELSVHYAELAAARRMLVTRSAYPVVVFHAGVILLSIPLAIVSGGWLQYFGTVIPTLGAFYLIVGGLWAVWGPLRRKLSIDSSFASFFREFPLSGRALSPGRRGVLPRSQRSPFAQGVDSSRHFRLQDEPVAMLSCPPLRPGLHIGWLRDQRIWGRLFVRNRDCRRNSYAPSRPEKLPVSSTRSSLALPPAFNEPLSISSIWFPPGLPGSSTPSLWSLLAGKWSTWRQNSATLRRGSE